MLRNAFAPVSNRFFFLLLGALAFGWVGFGWIIFGEDPRAIALVLVHLALLALAVSTEK